jgi:hypothetical protein
LLTGCTPSAENARTLLERSGIAVELDTFVQAAGERELARLSGFTSTFAV